MITPFSTAPDCSDESLVLNNYGDDISLCYLDHEKLRAAQAYFSVGCINAAYVILSTGVFVYFAAHSGGQNEPHNKSSMQTEDWHRLLDNWRRTSLRKRSIFGTLVGAVGHFLMSSSILLAQAFYTYLSCEIYTWGVILGVFTWLYAYCWRACRLNYLLRLNKLKAQFANWMQSQALHHGGAQHDHVAYEEFMRYREGYFYRVSYAAYGIILVVFAVVCVCTEIFALRRRHPGCKAEWGIFVIAAVLGVFVLFTPIIIWQLRRSKDLHGIRTELMIEVAVGIPCYILMLIWFGIYGRLVPAATGSHYMHFFSPANWSIIFTSATHLTSVVFPLIQVLIHYRRTKHTAIMQQNPGGAAAAANDEMDDGVSRISTRVDAKPCSLMQIRTLQQLLSDPDTVQELLQLSIQDFSSENILFYEAYLKLVDKVKCQGAGRQHPIYWFPWLRSSTTLLIPDIEESPDQISLFTESIHDEALLNDFKEFYSTYIREGAPLQVNISCKARCDLDKCFAKMQLSTPPSKISRLTESPHRWGSVQSFYSAPPGAVEAAAQQSKNTTSVIPGDGSRRPSFSSTNRSASVAVIEMNNYAVAPSLTLAIFEHARKEVFWNIFASVYPKYIAKENKSHTHCTRCRGNR